MEGDSMLYGPEMTLRDARALYFRLNGFGEDGGYEERWIKVKVWRIPIWLPNTPGRRRAVKLHDIHHVLTEYPTTWRGEAEISAWEVGTGGPRRYYAGWFLDLLGIAQGLVVNPRGVYQGFMRGRQSRNLFAIELGDDVLEARVGEFRQRLKLYDLPLQPKPRDHAAFILWSAVSVLTYVVAITIACAPLLLLALLILLA